MAIRIQVSISGVGDTLRGTRYGDMVDDMEPYDIDKTWLRLRKHHAEQCQGFLREHSTRIGDIFTSKLDQGRLNDEVDVLLAAL